MIFGKKNFLRDPLLKRTGMICSPTILPNNIAGGSKINSLIRIAQIGCGRYGTIDMVSTMSHTDLCRMVALSDLDSKRLEIAKSRVENFYRNRNIAGIQVKTYSDFHDVINSPDIDAVIVSVPDHQHAFVAIKAVLAGKDVYIQKPVTYSINEGIALRTAVRAKKRILQTGSQQRSEKPWNTFRIASEAVRNGRIGKLKTIKIGIGVDKIKGLKPVPQPVPANLDFKRWLGNVPDQPYMEYRVHPQDSLEERPGWITTEDFALGRIANWGSHHIDIAQWAMGMERSGPVSVTSRADFMQDDVWTVHTNYHVEINYPNDIQMILDNDFPNGLLFEGEEGSVFCARFGQEVTKGDGVDKDNAENRSLYASNDKILSSRIGPEGKIWMPSDDHYRNWLECIVKREDPVAPVDEAVRSMETCSVSWIAMKLNRKLYWDPVKEQFIDDSEANSMLSRKSDKTDFDIVPIMKRAGLV